MTPEQIKARKQQNEEPAVSGSWKPESINEEERTVDLVWTTGADVLRFDWWTGKEYVERLVVDDDSIDLTRLKAGAALLNAHSRYSMADQIGVVEDAWVDGGEGHARVRFASDPTSDEIFRKVADGIARNISVGYEQTERKITEHKDQPDLHEITRWSPFELSLVPVPADAGAQVRILQHKDRAMPDKPEPQTDEPAATPAPPAPQRAATTADVTPIDATKVANEAKRAERERRNWIEEHCSRFDLGDLKRELADSDLSLDECRTRVLDALAKRDDESHTQNQIQPGDGKREVAFADALTRAAFVKVDPSKAKELDDDARTYAHLPYRELARLAMEADGVSARNLPPGQMAEAIIKHANQRASVTTSVLTSVNANISSRALLMGYDAVPRTFLPIFRQTVVTNYRPNERVALGDAPVLPVVAEDANYTEVQLGDRKETWLIAKYGHIIKLTREMIVNDDLNAFARMLQMEGAAAARTENNIVWAILTANGNLADTNPIFDAGEGTSSGAAAGITSTTFYAARTAMNAQTSEQGQVLGLEPSYVVFDPSNRVAVEQLVRPPGPYTESTIGNVLVESYANGLTLVMEPQALAANVFFIANNALIDTVEFGWLEGNAGANVATDTVFESDAVRYRVRDEFGAGCVDRRGMYRLLA